MTREERIREKLKFFNLEKETLEHSRKMISKKVSKTATRFGPRASNLSKKYDNDGKQTQYNPFEEMMAIEAEFGSIFESHDEAQLEQMRNKSKWYPMFECMT